MARELERPVNLRREPRRGGRPTGLRSRAVRARRALAGALLVALLVAGAMAAAGLAPMPPVGQDLGAAGGPATVEGAGRGGPDAQGRSASETDAAAAPSAAGTRSVPSVQPLRLRPLPTPTVRPTPAPPANAAPTRREGFSLQRTVVPMRFPFATDIDYEYRDNFLERRAGIARGYNHIRGVLPDGTLQRAHDGVDIYVPHGTRVVAPFDGVVIDPRVRWRPWDPARYGKTVVVVSTEAASRGYAALLVHLSRVTVLPGDAVERGQLVGRTGDTGNAEATRPHLHFELRAPFRLHLREAGRTRRIDAFNPFPSLRDADPRARGGSRDTTRRSRSGR